jgi:hypothetical protein
MDYTILVKKLSLPPNFKAPIRLEYADLVTTPLTRAVLKADVDAVNSSIETIRSTRGGPWPEGEVDEKFNELDLAWHEREFREATSFAYVIHDSSDKYIGCFYLYPLGGERTQLTDELKGYDVDANWWVTAEANEQGYYEKAYEALKTWMDDYFPFKNIYYSNAVIPE